MANVGDRLTVFTVAVLVLAAIVGLGFLAGYLIGRMLL
jgi:hypothetical protein